MSDKMPDWLKELTDEKQTEAMLRTLSAPEAKPVPEEDKKSASYVHRRMNEPRARPK